MSICEYLNCIKVLHCLFLSVFLVAAAEVKRVCLLAGESSASSHVCLSVVTTCFPPHESEALVFKEPTSVFKGLSLIFNKSH